VAFFVCKIKDGAGVKIGADLEVLGRSVPAALMLRTPFLQLFQCRDEHPFGNIRDQFFQLTKTQWFIPQQQPQNGWFPPAFYKTQGICNIAFIIYDNLILPIGRGLFSLH
jgi:hypothetical protein